MERAISSPHSNPGSNRAEAFPAAKPAGNVFVELTKARLSALVVVTTAVGYAIALPGQPIEWITLVFTLLGTTLAAFGANVLNQAIEVPRDLRMERTRNRPIPSGRIGRRTATVLGIVLGLIGPALLWATVNGLAALLAFATLAIYVGIYTPLKPLTSLNTLVGAICGALPPMIGWVAATGRIEVGAMLLALLLFFWQMPHFLALAWMYRDDYERGGFKMLPGVDRGGQVTFNVMILNTAALIVLGPVVTLRGLSGWSFAAESIALGIVFLVFCTHFRSEPTRANARGVFFASLVYLPAVLGLMLIDSHNPPSTPGSFVRATGAAAHPATAASEHPAPTVSALAAHDSHDARGRIRARP